MFDVTISSSSYFGIFLQGQGRAEWWVRLSAVQTLTGLRVRRPRGGYADVDGLWFSPVCSAVFVADAV